MSWPLFDRIRALTRIDGLYSYERLLQDQTEFERITSGGEFLNFRKSRSLLEQTNLQVNKLERYKDYDQMDEVGEIQLALDLYADESSLIDPELKHSIMVKCPHKAVKEDIEDFLYNILMMDRQARPWIRYLCKYGDLPCEIVPTRSRDGVAALRLMDVYNFTRVETKYGDLVGFYYQNRGEAQAEFLHPWQVMHARLGSEENVYRPYGRSILDGGRKHFKQLRLMEDAALIYRVCLKGDTRVWTPNGYTYIKDLKCGDSVYSFTKELKVKETKVSYVKCNGIDKLYKVKSLHREIIGNRTHPILVECPDGSARYVDIKDIIPGKHKFILPRNSEHVDQVKLSMPAAKNMARGWAYIGKKIGIKKHVQSFLGGKHLEESKAVAVLEYAGGNPNDLIRSRAWAGVNGEKEFYPPERADEKFARWFGFMIGDGYISERSGASEIGFAAGDDQEINKLYQNLFGQYVGESVIDIKDNRINKYYTYSKKFVEFMKLNGFISGAHNKRIPSWVFQSPKNVQEAFIDGYVDADGHKKIFKGGVSESIELCCCNKSLMEDFKELCHMIGYNVGCIRNRAQHIEDGRMIKDTVCYELHFTKSEAKLVENILSVEEDGEGLVYDIGVDAAEHNFIANGVPVHNTRAPEKRIFTIPIGNIPAMQVSGFIASIARQFKKRQFFDPGTGDVNERYQPMIQEDDFWLPQRPDGSGPKIDTLPGAQNLDDIKDIEYFKKKMVAALKIPFSRVGIGDAPADGHRSLAAVSPDFAKAIQWVQREMCIALKKAVIVHLALRGYDTEKLRQFDLYMTASSAIDELYRIETWGSRVDVIGGLKDTELFTDRWILTRFTDMTEDEMDELEEEKRIEKEYYQLLGIDTTGGGFGGGGMAGLGGPLPGAGGPPGGGLTDMLNGAGGPGGDPGGNPGGPSGVSPGGTSIGGPDGGVGGLPAAAEDIIDDDRLIIEARKVKLRTSMRIISENRRNRSKFNQVINSYDGLLNFNEFDDMKGKDGKVLVESRIENALIEEAKNDVKMIINVDQGNASISEDTDVDLSDIESVIMENGK